MMHRYPQSVLHPRYPLLVFPLNIIIVPEQILESNDLLGCMVLLGHSSDQLFEIRPRSEKTSPESFSLLIRVRIHIKICIFVFLDCEINFVLLVDISHVIRC